MTTKGSNFKSRAAAVTLLCLMGAGGASLAAADTRPRVISAQIEVVDVAQRRGRRQAPCPGCRLILTLAAPRDVGGVTCYEAGRAEIRGPDGRMRFGARIDQTQMIEMGGSTLAMISLMGDAARGAALMEVELFSGAARVRFDGHVDAGAIAGSNHVAALRR